MVGRLYNADQREDFSVTEFGSILAGIGLLLMVILGQMKHHQKNPPKWVLNPMMNMLIWIPFIAFMVGIIIAIDSILGTNGVSTTIADEAVSLIILGGAIALAVIIRKRGIFAKAA